MNSEKYHTLISFATNWQTRPEFFWFLSPFCSVSSPSEYISSDRNSSYNLWEMNWGCMLSHFNKSSIKRKPMLLLFLLLVRIVHVLDVTLPNYIHSTFVEENQKPNKESLGWIMKATEGINVWPHKWVSGRIKKLKTLLNTPESCGKPSQKTWRCYSCSGWADIILNPMT